MKRKTYIIRSEHRTPPNNYFVGIHSYTPIFGRRDMARRFTSAEMATAYAQTELFTTPTAYTIIPEPERP